MNPYILVGILFVVLVLFGVTGALNSYAQATQANAILAVAQVAQVNAWGNLIAIVTPLVFVVIVAAGVYFFWRNIQAEQAIQRQVQLETLKTLQRLSAPRQPRRLAAPVEMDYPAWADEEDYVQVER
jgi:uncharacterized membrane protein YhdT